MWKKLKENGVRFRQGIRRNASECGLSRHFLEEHAEIVEEERNLQKSGLLEAQKSSDPEFLLKNDFSINFQKFFTVKMLTIVDIGYDLRTEAKFISEEARKAPMIKIRDALVDWMVKLQPHLDSEGTNNQRVNRLNKLEIGLNTMGLSYFPSLGEESNNTRRWNKP